LSAGASEAQDSLRVGVVEAKPGDAVVVPITADTTQPLNLLSFDVSFDPSLCNLIRDESVVRAGRSIAEVQEGGLHCPAEGIVRIVFLNLVGGAAVPAGSGPIAEWRFDIRPDAPAGVFPLAVMVSQASNGPIRVQVEPFGGQLGIIELPPCTADCNTDQKVSVDELLLAVEIALGEQGLDECPAADRDGDGALVVSELVAGLKAAVEGCPR
jgi:hypothetical protein